MALPRLLQPFQPPHSDQRWDRAVTIVTMVGVAVLLLWRATSTGLWCDELLFEHSVESGILESLMKPGSSHPPLLRVLVAPLVQLSAADGWLRLPSILLAVGTVPLWAALLRRLIADPWTRRLLLPAMATNVAWLGIGFQLTPYAALVFFASLHALCWCWCLERPGWFSGLGWLASGLAACWSHFYGINLLVADQAVFCLLVWRGSVPLRWWVRGSVAWLVGAAPMVPLLVFFSEVDRPFIASIGENYWSYLHSTSTLIFSRTTVFGLRIIGPAYLLAYLAAGIQLVRGLRGPLPRDPKGRSAGDSPPEASFSLIAAGVFLGGMPAMQLHGWLAENMLWERYALVGAWIHLPLLVLAAGYAFPAKRANFVRRALAAACCLLGLYVTSLGAQANSLITRDYGDVVQRLREQAAEGDVFLAQDVDIWVGAGNFDRQWFERYGGNCMPVVSGPRMLRSDLLDKPLPLASLGPEVRRVWVFTLLLNEPMLRGKVAPGWRLERIERFGRNYPLALYTREASSAERPHRAVPPARSQ